MWHSYIFIGRPSILMQRAPSLRGISCLSVVRLICKIVEVATYFVFVLFLLRQLSALSSSLFCIFRLCLRKLLFPRLRHVLDKFLVFIHLLDGARDIGDSKSF